MRLHEEKKVECRVAIKLWPYFQVKKSFGHKIKKKCQVKNALHFELLLLLLLFATVSVTAVGVVVVVVVGVLGSVL